MQKTVSMGRGSRFLSGLVKPSSPSPVSVVRGTWLAVAGLGLLLMAAYANGFRGAFVFDDGPAIVQNPSIRRLWPLSEVLFPALSDGGITISGRPVVNLSLALNRALTGEGPWGFHAGNLAIHAVAALLLLGVVRRTLRQAPLTQQWGGAALPCAFAAAAVWALHPLQTAAVTYLVQRAEALAGLFYLLTLYAFIRGAENLPAAGSRRWLVLSVAACAIGMASKEVVATAPLMVLLYDRTFVAGGFGAAWQKRRAYYLGLGATWLLLAALVASTGGRGGTAGLGAAIAPWTYALTQCEAIVHYLRLIVWPDPLVFDYGVATVGSLGEVGWQALLVVALVAATVVALVWRPLWGFAGAWFLLILAPSSSIVPVATQTMAEHRLYLALAAPVVAAIAGLRAGLGRKAWPVWAGLILLCGILTARRNEDYRSAETLWRDTVDKVPANGRAHNNLGEALLASGRPGEALASFQEAARLQPGVAAPWHNQGLALARLNRTDEAVASYREAIRLQPDHVGAWNNLGNALLRLGRADEARAAYEGAIRLRPELADGYSNLANLFLEQGQLAAAVRYGEESVSRDTRHPEARYNLGNALASSGRFADALAQYEVALEIRPNDAEVANNLGNVLVEMGRLPEALARYELAVALKPGFVEPRRNLVAVLAHLNRPAEALAHCRVLARLLPDDPAVQDQLARLQATTR